MRLNSDKFWQINLASPVLWWDYHPSPFPCCISFPARYQLPSRNIFLWTFACLFGVTCLYASVRDWWKEERETGFMCMWRDNIGNTACLSQPTGLLRWCCWSPARQMASIWSGRCCNGGPEAANTGCVPSAGKTLTFLKAYLLFPYCATDLLADVPNHPWDSQSSQRGLYCIFTSVCIGTLPC